MTINKFLIMLIVSTGLMTSSFANDDFLPGFMERTVNTCTKNVLELNQLNVSPEHKAAIVSFQENYDRILRNSASNEIHSDGLIDELAQLHTEAISLHQLLQNEISDSESKLLWCIGNDINFYRTILAASNNGSLTVVNAGRI